MTIKLVVEPPPPAEEGVAQVYAIELPSQLDSGAWIVGKVKIKNIGPAEDDLRALVTTEWNGKKYQGSAKVPVGIILTLSIASGLIMMPDVDAVVTVDGQHLEAGVWVTDDTKTH